MQEFSYGIIPLRKKKIGWEVLLIQHHSGHWTFPKGHAESNETHRESAERELFEETGLKVKDYLSEEPLIESYFFFFHQKRVHKTVQYFVAEVNGEVIIQKEEILASKWVPISEASSALTFPQAKNLLANAQKILTPKA